jgi:uncharacterized DUF497 family protein
VPTLVYGSFEWDEDKAEANLAKHGVSFEEAALALKDRFSLDIADTLDPTRIITIGRGASNVLYVISTDRNDRIRIISARKATPNEQRAYEETR